VRSFAVILVTSACLFQSVKAGDIGQKAWELESQGDAAGARAMLHREAQSSTAGAETLEAYADFLDRHHDPGARAAYERLLLVAQGPTKLAATRRLVLLDVFAEDLQAAAHHLQQFQESGGSGWTLPSVQPAATEKAQVILIPGPLRSFARMAALAPDVHPEDLMSALARNIVTNGYQATASNEALEQTEYLKLIVRYLTQARELEKQAGTDKVIKIDSCESSQTNDLLRVLGYRMRGACGSDVVLETVNATRAFLTIDSGFPLAQLEQSLRTNRPFVYDYKPTEVPVLYGPEYWLSAKEKQTGDFLDFIIGDPSLCRLYLGMAKLDPQTADDLKKTVAIQKIRAFAHVLDFYGAMFEIRDGKAVVPGGARTEKTWAELVGVAPDKGAAFFERLVARDDGWLASYFDSLLRITYVPANGQVQQYLTDPDRLKRFYAAIRGKVTSPGPARPVFRSNSDMMLLTTRLRLDPDGKPHVPGGIEVWRDLFVDHPHGKYDAKLTKTAGGWKGGDDVLEALFALTRKSVENEPLKIFLALSDMDRNRATPLDGETAARLARDFPVYGSQYSLFSEVPEITNAGINDFLDTAEAISETHDIGLRADAAGTFQGVVALWQILYRQQAIAPADAGPSFTKILAPFGKAKGEKEVFEAGRNGVKVLLAATKSPAAVSPQDRMIDLLAGAAEPADADAHAQLVEEMIRIFESQRLISLTTLFELVDNLESLSRGEKVNQALISKAANRIAEIQLPRASLSTVEKNQLAFGYWPEKHIEQQRKLNLRALIDRSGNDPKKLDDIRSLLGPFLRDTLVGLAYVHYAPPGAQILYTNPLFVRSHDFIGLPGSNQTWRATELLGGGWPTSAGGKLSCSLSGLPYALAEAEQNFLVPTREQALIWGDLVPQMILSATVPRWWNVTPSQLHWVALHMTFAENRMAEAVLSPVARQDFLDALSRHAPPARTRKMGTLLASGQMHSAVENIMPSEMFEVAADMIASTKSDDGPIAKEIRREAAEQPKTLNYSAISRAFGTPKPTLANSFSPQLLNIRTFPTLMGYSSRILAESWESNLLYYATIADELQIPPSQLNVLVPEWTKETVERIFATHLEDWPALLRSLRLVGEEVRLKSRKSTAAALAAAAQ
jgi:hypothetical protein